MRSEYVQCPRCGKHVNGKGLSSHMRGKECAHGAALRRAKRLGYEHATWSVAKRLKALGIEFKVVPPDPSYKYSTTRQYAPSWAVRLAELKPRRMWAHVLPQYMQRVHDDEQLQKAVLTTHKVGGDKALLAMMMHATRRQCTEDIALQMCARAATTAACGGKDQKPPKGWE